MFNKKAPIKTEPKTDSHFVVVDGSGTQNHFWAYYLATTQSGFVTISNRENRLVAAFYRPIAVYSLGWRASAADAREREAEANSTGQVGQDTR